MAKKKPTLLKVKFGKQVSFGERSASIGIKFPIKDQDHVGYIWANYYKRRFIGRLLLGDAMPNQKTLDGEKRLVVAGAFDTQKPSFGETDSSLTLTFEQREVCPNDLVKLGGADGLLEIQEITEIPDEPKEKKTGKTLWETRDITEIGLANTHAGKCVKQGVTTVGDLVDVILGSHPQFDTLTKLGVPKSSHEKVQEKLDLFFEDQGVENPCYEEA